MAHELKLLFVVWLVAACFDINSRAFATTTEPTTTDNNITSVTINETEPTTPTNVATTLPPVDTNTTTPVPTHATVSTANGSTPLPTTDPCTPNPCSESTCEPRYGEFVCICLAGDFYNYETQTCERAKIFPGVLNVPGIEFVEAMVNKTSAEFFAAADNITTELRNVFNDTDGYTGSIVLKLYRLQGSDSSRSSGSGVSADVEISFKLTATITATEITNNITEYATNNNNSQLSGAEFTEGDLCQNARPCDPDTTQCKYSNGLIECGCLEGYIPSTYSTKQCWVCPNGQIGTVNGTCENCPFGFSGLLCADNWKLTLVIVGSILGGLLLITLIALIVVCATKSSKKNRNADARNPYMNRSPAALPTNDSAFTGDLRMIPRATSKWDAPNLNRNPSTRQQNVDPVERNSHSFEDQDNAAPYGRSRLQSNAHAQGRFQSNHYAENRQQKNPYASKQGYTNSNYQHDNGKRFY